MIPFELFCFKQSKYFEALLFFLVACNKKFQRANAHRSHTQMPQMQMQGEMNTGLTSMHMARGFSVLYHVFALAFFLPLDSLFCITCSLESNMHSLFSITSCMSVALHYSMLHRFEIFSTPWTIAHCSIIARLLVGNDNDNDNDNFI